MLEAFDDVRETYLVIETIHISSLQETWEKTLKIRETDITFKLDTEAEANVLPLNIFNAVKQEQVLQKTKTVLTAFGDSKIYPLGTVVIPC